MDIEFIAADVRSAWRSVLRRPAFTLLVTITLAVGVGVNTAVFTLIDAVLLKPLPFRDPSRLVYLWQTLPEHNVFELEATPADYEAWQAIPSLSQIAMVAYGSFTLTEGDNPERLRGARMTSSLMPLLGIGPRLGRGFTPAEDFDANASSVVLSDGLWRRRFGADPSILGRVIHIDSTPFTVIGVMPAGATIPAAVSDENELWLPMRMGTQERVRPSHSYTVLGRIADDVAIAPASAAFEAFAARQAEEPSHRGVGARMVPVAQQTVRTIRPALIVSAASVALLLLVAAANACTLLIARASNRRHDLVVRAALGATRARLITLSIAECGVFAVIGGGAGLVLASWTLHALVPLFAVSLPPSADVRLDGLALLFTAAIAALIGVVFGFIAAFKPANGLAASLGSASRVPGLAAVGRSRTVLVVAQVAVAVVLMSAAGLMLSSVAKLSHVSPGFDPNNVLSFKITLTGARYASAASTTSFIDGLLERLTASTPVRSAAVTSVIPFGGTRGANVVDVEGRPRAAGEPSMIVDQRHVSIGYFDTMKIGVVTGRTFTTGDRSQGERVVVINETMARQYFQNESPLNRRVRLTAGFDSGIWMRIVGVVRDVRHISLARDAVPEMYHPIAQAAVPTFNVVVRTTGDPMSAVSVARTAVQALDRNLPIYDIQTMDDRIASSFARTRAIMLLLSVTAALATVLAGVAIYGSIWYSVVQRTPEIGIRMALGASRASVFREVVASALALSAFGAIVGAAIAMGSGSLLRTFLFGTATTDPATYAAVIGGVVALSIVASLVPASRAMRVDPMIALRTE